LKYLKQIREKLKEIYVGGLSKNQRILAFVILGLLAANILLWFLKLKSQPKITGVPDNSSNASLEPNYTTPGNSQNTSSGSGSLPATDSGATSLFEKTDNANEDGGNPVKQIQLPPVRHNTGLNAEAAPGPMDGTIAKIKEDYKNSPKYDLIIGYLAPLKEIADGRRAWNDWFRQSAVELLGEKKGREVEAEIKRLNGNKDERIRKMSFNTLDEVSAAVKKDTENYIEKGAIDGFLDQAKVSSDGKYPWTETMVGAGEYNLEKAWVDQVDARVRAVKEAKARKFQALNYTSLDRLITAIKEDTKNYEQAIARDMFLDYIREIYRQRKLTEPDVLSGGDLLEEYHLEALKRFVNK